MRPAKNSESTVSLPHQFQPGQSGNPKGRAKGSQNKFTSLKDKWLEVFNRMEEDEQVEGLYEWATKNPTNRRVYYQLTAKMLPANLSVDTQMSITYEVSEKFLPDALKGEDDEGEPQP